MLLKKPQRHYAPAMIAMHWLMLLLLIAVYACIELREFFPKDSDPRAALKHWHFMLGLSVFALVWLRLLLRLLQTTPPITPPLPAWQQVSSRAVHGALYLIMIAMPLLGWSILSAAGKPIPFFIGNLPPLLAENRDLAETLEEIHEFIGTAGYVLIGLHAVAALYHHYVQGDDTLRRMLPRKA